MGDKTSALAYLEKALQEHGPWLIYLAVNPKWDSLRSDPRFIALEKKIGLVN